MSTAKAPVVELGDPGIEPEVVTFEVRGKRYTFRELEIGEYNKLLKSATTLVADESGEMQENTDTALLLQLMIPKSCIDPKLTPEIVAGMGSRGYRALARIVNDLHYGDEPIRQIKADDEETPKGNE